MLSGALGSSQLRYLERDALLTLAVLMISAAHPTTDFGGNDYSGRGHGREGICRLDGEDSRGYQRQGAYPALHCCHYSSRQKQAIRTPCNSFLEGQDWETWRKNGGFK